MKTELYQTNAKSQSHVLAHFTLINIIIEHVVKHQSVISKYMQKAEEPENDAGLMKVIITPQHVYMHSEGYYSYPVCML